MKSVSEIRRAAFSLVEVTLALGVAGFCLVVVFGLIPVGLKSNQVALEQTAAGEILSAAAVDLRATPTSRPAGQQVVSSLYGIAIPAHPLSSTQTTTLYFDESGGWAATPGVKSRYRLTARFLPNGSGAKTAAFVNLKVTWPPEVDPAQAVNPQNPQPAGSVQAFVALDRN